MPTLAEHERVPTNELRCLHRAILKDFFVERLASNARVFWQDLLRSPEPRVRAREMRTNVQTSGGGVLQVAGNPMRCNAKRIASHSSAASVASSSIRLVQARSGSGGHPSESADNSVDLRLRSGQSLRARAGHDERDTSSCWSQHTKDPMTAHQHLPGSSLAAATLPQRSKHPSLLPRPGTGSQPWRASLASINSA